MSARYSRQAGFTIAKRSSGSRPAIRTVQRRVRFGPTTAKFMGLAVLAILAIVMLSQSGTSATSVYQQNQLRQKTSQVDQEMEALQLEAKRAQSLQSIQQTPVKDKMESVGKVEFVEKGEVAGVSTQAKP